VLGASQKLGYEGLITPGSLVLSGSVPIGITSSSSSSTNREQPKLAPNPLATIGRGRVYHVLVVSWSRDRTPAQGLSNGGTLMGL
jgi:hypothetical protein